MGSLLARNSAPHLQGGIPNVSPKVRSCKGAELFSNSSNPRERRSSSVRQEKLAPWSSLRTGTSAMTSTNLVGSPGTGCRLSTSSPRSSTAVRLLRGAPPFIWQLNVRFSPTGCQGGRGASSMLSGDPGKTGRKMSVHMSWRGAASRWHLCVTHTSLYVSFLTPKHPKSSKVKASVEGPEYSGEGSCLACSQFYLDPQIPLGRVP